MANIYLELKKVKEIIILFINLVMKCVSDKIDFSIKNIILV